MTLYEYKTTTWSRGEDPLPPDASGEWRLYSTAEMVMPGATLSQAECVCIGTWERNYWQTTPPAPADASRDGGGG